MSNNKVVRPGKRQTKYFRANFILVTLALGFSLLIVRAVILSLSDEAKLRTNVVLMNRAPVSLQQLTSHIGELEVMTSNIEKVSLGEIKLGLENTIRLVNQSNMELKAQYDAWIRIKDEIKKDDAQFRGLRNQLTHMQSLQDEEILRLKNMLNKAQKPSIFADATNLFLSFVLGVLSSIIATRGLRWWEMRKLKNPRARGSKRD